TSSAIGTGTLTINGGTIDNTSGGGITLSTNNIQAWGGDFTFNGTNALNLGTGAATPGATRRVTINRSGALTLGGVSSGSGFGLTKAGTGQLNLTGANTYTGSTNLRGGTLNLDFSATTINILNNSSNSSDLQLNGGTLTLTGKSGATNTQQFNGTNV